MENQHAKQFNNIIKRLDESKNAEDIKLVWSIFNEFRNDLNSYYPLAESDIDGFKGEISDVGIRDSLTNFMVGLELIEEHFDDGDQSLVREGWYFIREVEQYLESEKAKSPNK